MSEDLEAYEGQIAIVGSGVAGLVAALALAPQPVVLLTRSALGAGTSSAKAQGGIAASLGSDDTAELHLADTLAAGDGHCDVHAGEAIIREAPHAIAALERWGVTFDRCPDGTLSLGLEAAHCRRRIVHAAGDGTGAEVVTALVKATARMPSVTVMKGMEVRRLAVAEGNMTGLCGVRGGQNFSLRTARVVLATGGIGGLFESTTNPAENFGQGIALAAKAGARLTDMEFVQFHPTALAVGTHPLPLVSEAVRGEGALLVNERGERFMAEIPGQELAPRDVVSRAIGEQIARGGQVFLDSRKLGTAFPSRFPAIYRLCRESGLDPACDLIPVRPAAHYHMGGIATVLRGRTSLAGLWAIGEVACTGMHGANRLASNSLLEAVAMGLRTAKDIDSAELLTSRSLIADTTYQASWLQQVRPVVSRFLGMIREHSGLEKAIAILLPWAEARGNAADPAIVGLLIAVFATLRAESRGAHMRSDFPKGLPTVERNQLTLSEAIDIARSFAGKRHSRSA